MRYCFSGRVRYSEVGEDGRLTLPGILNYFQDCSTFQSEAIHLGVGDLKKKNRFWVLNSWQVVVDRYPRFGEEIETATWAYDFKGFLGMRNFAMKTTDGESLAYANTFWSYLDREKGVPVKLTDEDIRGYDPEEKLEMHYEPRKIKLPAQREEKPAFAVQKQQLDTNHHVNNSQYIRMAEFFLPEDFAVRQMRAEYKKQARLGDIICPEICMEDDRVTVLLNTQQHEPYAVVEFR